MSFFSRVQVKKYNPNHGKDGKFSTSDEAGGPKSITDTPDGAHKNLSAYDGILAHIQASIPAAEYAAHGDVLRAAVEHALTFNPDLNSKAKAMFVMNALKEKFAGWGTPSKIIRKLLQTKVPYAHGNTAFAAIHGVLVANETGAHHEAPSAHVSENLPAAVAPKAPDVKPVEAPAPAAMPAVNIIPITDDEPAKPAPKPAPDLSGKTPMQKFKAVLAHHVGEEAHVTGMSADTWNGVMGAAHTAFMQASGPKSFANKMSEAINDLHAQGKISVDLGAQIAQSGLMGLHDKLHEALGKAPPVAPAAVAAPAPAPAPKTPVSVDPVTAFNRVLTETLKNQDKFDGEAMKVAQDAVLSAFHTTDTPAAFDHAMTTAADKLEASGKLTHEQAVALSWSPWYASHKNFTAAADGMDNNTTGLALTSHAFNTIAPAKPQETTKLKPAAPVGDFIKDKPKSPISTGDVVHDNVMNVMHFSGNDFTDKEKIVGSNMAKNALPVSDDAPQFEAHVHEAIDGYAKQYAGNVDAEKLKALPWHIVHDESKKAFEAAPGGKVPASIPYTDAAKVAASFPDKQVTASPAAPAPAPVEPVKTPPAALPKLSAAALDEEVHNQLNQAGYQGQGSAAQGFITDAAKKAFLASDGTWASFDHKLVDEVTKAKSASAATAMMKVIDSVKLHAAVQDGTVQTALDDATAKKATVAYNPAYVDSPGSILDTPAPEKPAPAPYVDNATALSPGPATLPNGYKPSPYQVETAMTTGHKLSLYDASKLYPTVDANVKNNLTAMGLSPGTKAHKIVLQAIMKNIPKATNGPSLKKKVMATIGQKLSDSTKEAIASGGMWATYHYSGQTDLISLKAAHEAMLQPASASTSTVSAHAASNLPAAVAPKASVASFVLSSTMQDAIKQAVKDQLPGLTANEGSPYHKGLEAAALKHTPTSGSGAGLMEKVVNDPATFSDVKSEAGKIDWSAIHSAALTGASQSAAAAKATAQAKAPFVPTAQHYADKVKEMAKNAGINPFAVEHMGDTAAKVAPFSGSANEFHAKAMEDLDKKVAAGTLKPSPSVDKLKNNIDWKVAFTEAQKDPADKAAAEAAAQASAQASQAAAAASAAAKAKATQNAFGNTDLDGYKRYDTKHADLGKVMNQRKLKSNESSALSDYKGNAYTPINAALRGGKSTSQGVWDQIQALDTATRAGTIPKGTVLYRGVQGISHKLGMSDPRKAVVNGNHIIDNGYASGSSSMNFSAGWDGDGKDKVCFELKFTKDTPAVHLEQHKGNHDGEQEVLMARGLKWKMVGYRWEKNQHVVTMEQEE